MANLTLAGIEEVLEELYLSEDRMMDMIMRDNPWLGIIPKSSEGGGQYRHVAVRHIRPQGRSAIFATAQTNRVGSQREAFDVTWVSNYQVAAIDGDVLDDAAGNRVILIDHIETEMDGAIDNMKDDLAQSIFNNKGGSRGVQDGALATGVLTLLDANDVANFEVGMRLQADDEDGSSAGDSLADTDVETIVSIDRDLGTLTISPATGAAFIDTNFLFAEGDYGLKMSGAEGWLPRVAPVPAENFFNVDRSVDPVRLAGVRYDGTSDTLNEAIVNGAARIRRWKKASMLTHGILNPIKWAELSNLLENRKRVAEVRGTGQAASIGYDAILLATPGGDLPIISDPNAPTDTCFLMHSPSWMLESTGQLVRLLDEDGNAFLRQSTADGWELRIKSRGNVWNKEPGASGRVTLA